MELIFDEENLKRVAEIVTHFNPHARGNLVKYMKEVAQECLEQPTYVATNGFMLTSYYQTGRPREALYIKASVSTDCFHNVELS